jgi:hypothetical protein
MKEDWVRVFASSELLRTKLVEDYLKQHGVESHILEHPDSTFPSIGEATLYTPKDRAEQAIALIRKMEEDQQD